MSTEWRIKNLILIDVAKSFNRIQYYLYGKKPKVTRNRRITSQYNKSYIWQIYNQYCVEWVKTESISSKILNNTKYLLSLLLYKVVLEVLSRAIWQDKQLKSIHIGKERNYPYFQMIWFYREKPKESQKTIKSTI
jgi:hypothetical protein